MPPARRDKGSVVVVPGFTLCGATATLPVVSGHAKWYTLLAHLAVHWAGNPGRLVPGRVE